jgi:hypothetical protein
MNVRYRAVLAAVTLSVGLYDLWAVRAAGYRFEWGRELPGYYDYLGRAFAGGHLYLPIQPAPELLAMSNPWDPATGEQFKMHDMSFYHGRYFLYHGAGPAVMLFAPWRILTGTDLPENFSLFLFCFGGFLFSCGTLWNILASAKVEPSTRSASSRECRTCSAAYGFTKSPSEADIFASPRRSFSFHAERTGLTRLPLPA